MAASTCSAGVQGHGVTSPPMRLIQELAERLRRHMGLNLFNFDVIVPLSQQQKLQHCAAPPPAANGKAAGRISSPEQQQDVVYHVIDINYFPGYEKLPGYEDLMVQFLSSIWEEPSASQLPQ
jgi:hypothetical protein